MMIEARCTRCGETFIPDSSDDLEHVAREDGQPCGGTGEITGSWQRGVTVESAEGGQLCTPCAAESRSVSATAVLTYAHPGGVERMPVCDAHVDSDTARDVLIEAAALDAQPFQGEGE